MFDYESLDPDGEAEQAILTGTRLVRLYRYRRDYGRSCSPRNDPKFPRNEKKAGSIGPLTSSYVLCGSRKANEGKLEELTGELTLTLSLFDW
ncbi:hypothetical protein ACH5RR_006390 [Cinchona calisaya]|uniref:Uncharacterized protein n=1 Tax=Cinchona calisaya TaxID=153742 RepID=A0ABD3ANX0_9GENT